MQRITIPLIIGSFLTLFLLNFCGTKYPKEVIGVDSLQVSLNKTQTELKAIDKAEINNKYSEIKENIAFIQQNYNDTLTLEMAEFLVDYSSVLKAFESVKEEYAGLEKELEFSSEQLNNLKHDLQYNIMNNDSVKIYCMREDQAVKRNAESLQAIQVALKRNMELSDKLTPQIRQLIENINAKQKKN